jgi:hypothetical protein
VGAAQQLQGHAKVHTVALAEGDGSRTLMRMAERLTAHVKAAG